MAEVLLKVKNLSTLFRTEGGVVKAVDNISFEVRAGETFALVGESGCGKSVTALSIMRLIPTPPGEITSGTVEFDGIDLLKLRNREMRAIRGSKIGMIFQEPMSSLNLAQAVMVCLYEFMRARTAAGSSAGGPGIDQADAAEVDRMARDMEEALTEIGFLSEVSPLPVMAALRSVFGRASLDDREVRIMSGIARQIMWYARGGREVAADKRSRGRKLR